MILTISWVLLAWFGLGLLALIPITRILREQAQDDEPRQLASCSRQDGFGPTRRRPARWRHITYV